MELLAQRSRLRGIFEGEVFLTETKSRNTHNNGSSSVSSNSNSSVSSSNSNNNSGSRSNNRSAHTQSSHVEGAEDTSTPIHTHTDVMSDKDYGSFSFVDPESSIAYVPKVMMPINQSIYLPIF